MIYQIEVSPQAREDLDSLAEWIASDNLEAAYRLYDSVAETVSHLARFLDWALGGNIPVTL